jgi:hypothetical protein
MGTSNFGGEKMPQKIILFSAEKPVKIMLFSTPKQPQKMTLF